MCQKVEVRGQPTAVFISIPTRVAEHFSHFPYHFRITTTSVYNNFFLKSCKFYVATAEAPSPCSSARTCFQSFKNQLQCFDLIKHLDSIFPFCEHNRRLTVLTSAEKFWRTSACTVGAFQLSSCERVGVLKKDVAKYYNMYFKVTRHCIITLVCW